MAAREEFKSTCKSILRIPSTVPFSRRNLKRHREFRGVILVTFWQGTLPSTARVPLPAAPYPPWPTFQQQLAQRAFLDPGGGRSVSDCHFLLSLPESLKIA